MKVKIDSQLGMTTLSDDFYKLPIENKDVFLFGSLTGIFANGRVMNKREAVNEITKRIDNGLPFKELLINSIGSFVLVIKESSLINIFVSPRGPGFFVVERNNELMLVENEKEFCLIAKDNGFNDFEILHMVLNPDQFRSPFTTIFKNTKRVIGGQVLQVSRDLKTNQDFYLPYNEYCNETGSLRSMAQGFKQRYEGIVNNVFETQKKENNYVLLSGGIDSCTILAAVKALNLDIKALHWRQSALLTQAVDYLCRKAGIPMELFGQYFERGRDKNWWQPYQKWSREYFKSGLGIIAIDNMYLEPAFTDQHSLFFAGHTPGLLYQGKPFMFPSFSRSYIKRVLKDTIQRKPKRLTYTQIWHDMVQNGLLNKALKGFVDKNYRLPKNSYEHLLGLILSYKYPMMLKSPLPPPLKEIENEYITYRGETVLKPILKDLYQPLLQGKRIPSSELDKFLRMTIFATGVQGACLNTVNYERAGDFTLVDPPLQGPIIDYFQRIPAMMREVFMPKQLQFQYFKDTLGFDYYRGFITDFNQASFFMELLDKIRMGTKKKSEYDIDMSKRDQIFASKEFKDLFFNDLNPKTSVLVEIVKDERIKKYIANLYTEILNGKIPSFHVMNQILNMEIFLKNIWS